MKLFAIYALLVLFDLFIYIALGLAQMNYDDKHDDSQSDYGSWGSMTTFDKLVFIFLVFWNIINLLVLARVIFSIYKKMNFGSQLNGN